VTFGRGDVHAAEAWNQKDANKSWHPCREKSSGF
jgi:hypothetical protein